ncbi:MAG: leucyl aminopeptidase [Burkholderiaceae bacterium]|jgi:leucyl aminopeptidase|nr:leucyl aminopeptidase [Burkholderiaceae bacterium]MDH5207594.1 leucyl aminopeptidase [Burkholderiaceae bacterium]
MEFSTKVGRPETVKTDALVVGVHADGELTPTARALDAAAGGALKAAVKSGDMSGKRGSLLLLRGLNGVAATRVLLVGLGGKDDFNEKAYADAVRAGVKAFGNAVRDIAIAAGDWRVNRRDHEWKAHALAIAARETAFRSDELKSKRDPDGSAVEQVALLLSARNAAAERGLRHGAATANGMELTKRLGNLPPNICTPTFLGEQARKLARQWKLGVEVLETKQLEALKMGSFLAVARGSTQPPRLIVLKYNGAAAKAAPVVLVGKGITFDSGGISLKPGAAMDEMKFDMCGAASVLGTMRALAELKLKLNVVGIVAACENMPAGNAAKPGDIVTSMSGQTIEILNTDAEGRLILCDALTYAGRFKPAAVVDMATLTGACVVALGNVNSGLFANNEDLAGELLAASRSAADAAWRMPLDEDYQEQLKSNFADMANIGTPGNAGAVTAACFLARFTKDYAWAHIDIAGTAWKSGAAKGATGRPVPLLMQFLINRAG